MFFARYNIQRLDFPELSGVKAFGLEYRNTNNGVSDINECLEHFFINFWKKNYWIPSKCKKLLLADAVEGGYILAHR